MTKVIDAIFDGEVFRPSEAVNLRPNTSIKISFEEDSSTDQSPKASAPTDLWTWLESVAGTIDGPEDWSEQHDHYLYSSPKRIIEQSE